MRRKVIQKKVEWRVRKSCFLNSYSPLRNSLLIDGDQHRVTEYQLVNGPIGERLKSERLRLGVAPADFAGACGVSRTTQFAYEGGARAPDADYLQRAADLGVDVLFVVTGGRSSLDSDFVLIRQHKNVAASGGPGAVNTEHDEVDGLSFSRKWLAKRGLNPSRCEVINVTGYSMEPRLTKGDKVLVDTADTTPRSGNAYVLLQGDELLVKYCQLLPDGKLRVSSQNEHYPPYDIDLEHSTGVSIIGRVRASTHEW